MKRKATSAGGEEDSTAESSDITTLVISGGVELPDNCKSLVKLKVELTTFDIPTADGCFPSLKTLEVSIRKPKNKFLNGLLRSCPVLEDFRFYATYDTSNSKDERRFLISVPTLKRLAVNLHVDELESASDHTFIIQTPNLEHLTITDYTVASFKIDEIHSLIEAEVSMGVTMNFYKEDNRLEDYELEDRLMGILRGIRRARSLHIDVGFSAALSLIYDDDFLPTFPSLRRLVLAIDFLNGWKLLPCFLRKSRVLQYLELNREKNERLDVMDSDDSDYENDFLWKTPEFEPYISPDLKEIKMDCLWRSEDERDVVNYLLEHAEGLKKMSMEYYY